MKRQTLTDSFNAEMESVLGEFRQAIADDQRNSTTAQNSSHLVETADTKWIIIVFGAVLIVIPLTLVATLIWCRRNRGISRPQHLSIKGANAINDTELRNVTHPYNSTPKHTPSIADSYVTVTKEKSLDQKLKQIQFDIKFRIDPSNLELDTKLGEGNFGKVLKGYLSKPSNSAEKLTVAVKCALDPMDHDQNDMVLDELKLMSHIPNHPNVLALIGGVNRPERGQVYVITELCSTSLIRLIESIESENFVDELRFEAPTPADTKGGYILPSTLAPKKVYYAAEKSPGAIAAPTMYNELSTADLLSFGMQIASGMQFLSSIPCIHRDLAARNVLITKDRLVRIADFGMARNKQYYRTIKSVNTPVPFWWMSPEALLEMKFSQASDVWSFGITLFELFSMGGSPYPHWEYSSLVSRLRCGERCPQPRFVHDELYQFMLECWKEDPKQRPRFKRCVEVLRNHLARASPSLLKKVDGLLAAEIALQESYTDWRYVVRS